MDRFKQKNGNGILSKSKDFWVNKIAILSMLCFFILGGTPSYANEINVNDGASNVQDQLTEIKLLQFMAEDF